MDAPNYCCDETTVLPPAMIAHKGRTPIDHDWREMKIRLTAENAALKAENLALRAHVALLTGKPEEPPAMGDILARAMSADSYWI